MKHLQRLGHAPLTCLLTLGLLDPARVLLAVGVGEPIEDRASLRVGIEGLGERSRNRDLARLLIQLEPPGL